MTSGERPGYDEHIRFSRELKDNMDRMREFARLDGSRYVATKLNGAVIADPVDRRRPDLGKRIRYYK